MSSIWAVAKNTISQALRLKVALTVILLLVILLPLMSIIMVGDGTLHGKLQTFISYGLSLTALLLSVLTIVISCYTLNSDLKEKQIYLVVTKPIRRFELLCGKLLGIIILDIFLLAVFACIIYGLTLSIPNISKADPVQVAQAKNEFFTARKSLDVSLDEAKLRQLTEQAYKKLADAGELPDKLPIRKIQSELYAREITRAKAVEVGAEKIWEFENVKLRDPNDILYVRFKYEIASGSPESEIYGNWLVGDYRQVKAGPVGWTTPLCPVDRYDVVQTSREFAVPASVVAKDGFLAVAYRNPPINQTTVFVEELEVLFRAGSFTANYIRAVIMILARLVFLAALGVSCSTWLSFPVAILVCMVIFTIGTINGFIVDSFGYLGAEIGFIYDITLAPLLMLLPRFDGEFNPTAFMISGRLLSGFLLLKIYALMVCLKSSLLLLFGMWVFSNREIAKVSA